MTLAAEIKKQRLHLLYDTTNKNKLVESYIILSAYYRVMLNGAPSALVKHTKNKNKKAKLMLER
jgi:hypothetical protein